MSSTAWRHFLWILIKAFLPSFQTRDHQQVESTKVIVKSTPCQLGWTMENGHFLMSLYLHLIYILSDPWSGHSRSGHSMNPWHYFKVWVLGQSHQISNICQPFFKFFSKDSFGLKFDDREEIFSSIGWFNSPIFSDIWGVIILCSNVSVVFFTLNTLYCKYLF